MDVPIASHIAVSIAMFVFVTSITPGPVNIVLLTSGVHHGLRATLPLLASFWLCYFLVLLFTGFGLGTLFSFYPQIYMAMKIASVIYFTYLAWTLVRDPNPTLGVSDDQKIQTKTQTMSFWGVLLFQFMNPKGVLMAAACFSSFASPQASPLEIFVIAALFSSVNGPSIGCWAVCGSGLRHVLCTPRSLLVFNCLMAAVLMLSLWPVLKAL